MGEIIDFRSKKKLTPEQEQGVMAGNKESEMKVVSAKSHLDNLTLEDSLAVREESKADVPLPEDLTRITLEGNLLVGSKTVEKVALDCFLDNSRAEGKKLSDQEQRALNNLIQLMEVGQSVVKRAGITADVIDPQLENIWKEIDNKKIEMLAKTTEEGTVKKIQNLKKSLEGLMGTEAWKTELTDRLKEKMKQLPRSANEFLDAREFVLSFDNVKTPEGLVDIVKVARLKAEKKKIDDLRDAISVGDFSGMVGGRSEEIEDLAKMERGWRDEFTRLRTAEESQLLKENISKLLVEQN